MSLFTEILICLYCSSNIIYIFLCAWQRDLVSMMVNQEYLSKLLKEKMEADQ